MGVNAGATKSMKTGKYINPSAGVSNVMSGRIIIRKTLDVTVEDTINNTINSNRLLRPLLI